MHPSVVKSTDYRKRGTKQLKKPSPLEKVPRNEADEVFTNKKVFVSLTSSTASGPPSPKGKAWERDLLFGLHTEVHFVTATTSDDRWSPLQSKNDRRMHGGNPYALGSSGTSVSTSEI